MRRMTEPKKTKLKENRLSDGFSRRHFLAGSVALVSAGLSGYSKDYEDARHTARKSETTGTDYGAVGAEITVETIAEAEKYKLTIEKNALTVEMPEEAFYLEGVQVAKRGIFVDVQKFFPDVTAVKFVETFKAAPKPETKA